jgi:hypothetical protein
MFCSSAGSLVVHDQELKRLRAEVVARQATPQSGTMKMLRGAEGSLWHQPRLIASSRR